MNSFIREHITRRIEDIQWILTQVRRTKKSDDPRKMERIENLDAAIVLLDCARREDTPADRQKEE